jgi:hypothetical protein
MMDEYETCQEMSGAQLQLGQKNTLNNNNICTIPGQQSSLSTIFMNKENILKIGDSDFDVINFIHAY